MQPELDLVAMRTDFHGVSFQHDAFAAHVIGGDARLRRALAPAGHEPKQVFLGDVCLLQHADVPTVAQHGRPVADAGHLRDPVGNDDHRRARSRSSRIFANNRSVELRSSAAEDFIENKHTRFAQQRTTDRDPLLDTQRQSADEHVKIKLEARQFRH